MSAILEKQIRDLGKAMSEGFGQLNKRIDGLSDRVGKNEHFTDTLAIMVKEGFDRIEEKMATKDDVKEIIDRLDVTDFRVNTHDRRLDNHQDKILVINKKIGLA